MMRIVCPDCGEEPKKGQRHICRPSVPLTSLVTVEPAALPREDTCSGMGMSQRRGLNATPTTVCASITSLVQKSRGLWRSTGALARCSGEAFVAGLLAAAISSNSWSKDPKTALISALTGRVADEAARAIQVSWRARFSSRVSQHPVKRDGYQQLALVAPKVGQNGSLQRAPHAPCSKPERPSRSRSGGSRARPPPLSVVLPRHEHVDNVTPAVMPAALHSPSSQPDTPRTAAKNKSNPRPSGARAVPMNPIQAMKQRKLQLEKDAEERRMQELLQAEDWRAARSRSTPSTPPSAKTLSLGRGIADDSVPSTADSEGTCMLVGRSPSAPSTPRALVGGSVEADLWQEPCPGALANAMEGALTPLERRALRQAVPSPRGPKPPLPASFAALGSVGSEPLTVPPRSAPTTLEQWRPAPATDLDAGCEVPRARTANTSMSPNRSSGQRGELTATARLQERMRQRENSGAPRAHSPLGFGAPRAHSPLGFGGTTTGSSGWQTRIEARQREVEELQEIEAQQKQQTEERCCRRNDALRKVMERQAQRQHDVDGLQEG